MPECMQWNLIYGKLNVVNGEKSPMHGVSALRWTHALIYRVVILKLHTLSTVPGSCVSKAQDKTCCAVFFLLMADRLACTDCTASFNEIMLPENFDTLDPSWETSTMQGHMADGYQATSQSSESEDPLFCPEQQAWIEALIQDCTSRSLNERGCTSSSAAITTPLTAPPHASASSGNVGELTVINFIPQQYIVPYILYYGCSTYAQECRCYTCILGYCAWSGFHIIVSPACTEPCFL